MTEILADELSHENGPLCGASGGAQRPQAHAEEVALDLPTTIVSASPDLEAAEVVQEVFSNTCMRVYTNTDINGRGAERRHEERHRAGRLVSPPALATAITPAPP